MPFHVVPIAVPLLEPHAAGLAGMVAQLKEALLALASMVTGAASLERCARAAAWPPLPAPPSAPCLLGTGSYFQFVHSHLRLLLLPSPVQHCPHCRRR
jgi:hypothetical protein